MAQCASDTMKPSKYKLLIAGCIAVFGLSGPATADPAQNRPEPNVLRICAAESQLPFSSSNGSGFENRIGAAVADVMGRKPQFVWANKPAIFLVRDYLDKNACDVVVGLDTGDERVLTTKPYYRSGYVFISRADRNLDVKSWKDPRIQKLTNIAVGFGSPAEVMLREIGMYEEDISYLFSLVNFKSRRNEYTQVDPARMVGEVAEGKADLAVAFAPEVARYVKSSTTPLRVTLIPDDNVRESGAKVPHHFSQSMGVRKNDPLLLAELDKALIKAQPQIEKILAEEGIITVVNEY